jgi:hypothetical protein
VISNSEHVQILSASINPKIEPAKTGPKLRDGTVPQLGRTSAAEKAGLSERRRKTALRVANIPSAEFGERSRIGRAARPILMLIGAARHCDQTQAPNGVASAPINAPFSRGNPQKSWVFSA